MAGHTPGVFQRLESFVREYTSGLDSRGVRRLFDRDAPNVYAVLTREHSGRPEPAQGFGRFCYRAKIVFLGLSYKLSPPRRLLFAVSLFGLLLGVFGNTTFDFEKGTRAFSLSGSPFWFLVSFGSLVFLLALELVDRVRVRDELEVARELQEDLLPNVLPPVPGYLFAHSYRTANEVGGDYYGLTPLPDGRLSLVVGDASGHGMAAGLVMAIANATLKTALDIDPSPESCRLVVASGDDERHAVQHRVLAIALDDISEFNERHGASARAADSIASAGSRARSRWRLRSGRR